MTKSASCNQLGVILASSSVPRVFGEIGEPTTNPPDTLYETTGFENFLDEMRDGLRPASRKRLFAARDALVQRGASRITTSCGLLWPEQRALQHECPVPIITSALCLIDRLRMDYGRAICVVTVDASFVPGWHGRDPARLEGLDFCDLGKGSYLYSALTGAIPATQFDPEEACASVTARICQHLTQRPAIKAIVLECTNLSPYAKAIRAAQKLPVFDIFNALETLAPMR